MGNPPQLNVPPAMQVYWQDPAGAGNDAIRRYFQAVAPLYSPVGMHYAPFPASGPAPAGPYYTVVFANKTLSPGQNDADGYAMVPTHRAYVYLNQLANFSGNKDAATEEVLAHELGHLAGLSHSVSGVMAPDITPAGVETNLHALDKKQLKRVGVSLRVLASGH
ncbi:MAG: matrixin family metalloprotease [Patescibacteria group bacterium]|nr:matrixin family metalloprotease [Patescibacteria group bacterium]